MNCLGDTNKEGNTRGRDESMHIFNSDKESWVKEGWGFCREKKH